MTTKARIINVSIPEYFEKEKEEADKLVEKDPRFKDALGNLSNRYNKKNKQNKFNSIKYRFYVSFYKYMRKKELNQQGQEKNGDERSKVEHQEKKDSE